MKGTNTFWQESVIDRLPKESKIKLLTTRRSLIWDLKKEQTLQ